MDELISRSGDVVRLHDVLTDAAGRSCWSFSCCMLHGMTNWHKPEVYVYRVTNGKRANKAQPFHPDFFPGYSIRKYDFDKQSVAGEIGRGA